MSLMVDFSTANPGGYTMTIDDLFLITRDLLKAHQKLSLLRKRILEQQAETPSDTLLALETRVEKAMVELHLASSIKL